mmetsp:Transcript_109151/g.209766  ORF Transcript_109151/g.209766 Transcript_109151/m.209766 type:complete len:263 (+) Transcript_109151:34-822(+)
MGTRLFAWVSQHQLSDQDGEVDPAWMTIQSVASQCMAVHQGRALSTKLLVCAAASSTIAAAAGPAASAPTKSSRPPRTISRAWWTAGRCFPTQRWRSLRKETSRGSARCHHWKLAITPSTLSCSLKHSCGRTLVPTLLAIACLSCQWCAASSTVGAALEFWSLIIAICLRALCTRREARRSPSELLHRAKNSNVALERDRCSSVTPTQPFLEMPRCKLCRHGARRTPATLQRTAAGQICRTWSRPPARSLQTWWSVRFPNSH